VWRTWGICTPAAIQEFCLKQVGVLQHLLSSDSCLARMKILDPCRLEQVLSSRAAIRNNYTSLVASALVEIFLRKAFHDQYKRGGPLWN
jgi:hypothetical protein